MKECEFCKEEIKEDAKVCYHCKRRQPLKLNTNTDFLGFFGIVIFIFIIGMGLFLIGCLLYFLLFFFQEVF